MQTTNQNQPDATAEASRQGAFGPGFLGRWIGGGAWIIAGLGVVGIFVVSSTGSRRDFAESNISTFLLSILVWLMLVVGMKNSRLPRFAWRSLLLLPLLALAAFLSVFALERIDGELVPRFRYRWAEPTLLPTVNSTTSSIAPELMQPRVTDYPQFLGPNRDGVIAATEVNPDWNTNPPTILWKKPIGDGWSGFAVQGDVAVTMEQRDAQEWVSAYDARNGTLLWNYAIDAKHANPLGGTGPRSTPLISGNRVYASSAVSRFVCLDLANGNEIWAQELLELSGASKTAFESSVAWGRSASPLLWNSEVIIPLGGVDKVNSLIGFDAESGEERWRAGNEQISYSSPTMMTLAGQEQLLIVTEGTLRSFDPTNHSELWTVPWPGHSNSSANVSQPIQVDADSVFISKGYGIGCQLIKIRKADEQWETEIVWENQTGLRTKFTSAVIYDGFAFGLSDGILECIDLENGERRWKKGRYKQGQVLLVGSNLLITSEYGQIVLVAADPSGLRELAKLQVIGDVSWNTPALSGNRLFVRNSDEAACVELPLLDAPSTTHETREVPSLVE